MVRHNRLLPFPCLVLVSKSQLTARLQRGSYNIASGKQAIYLLNTWAVENGIVLGQLEFGAKTNEITAAPEMIDALDIAGAIISGDALITQNDIAAKIIDAKADYYRALNGNHKN